MMNKKVLNEAFRRLNAENHEVILTNDTRWEHGWNKNWPKDWDKDWHQSGGGSWSRCWPKNWDRHWHNH